MKTIVPIFLLLLLALLSLRTLAQKPTGPFKPGDWFECEMEFEDGIGVFRNHYFRQYQPGKSRSNDLLSVRFQYLGDYKWNYKVLRYRSIEDLFVQDQNRNELFCFDTWYPDYFEENFDSIRKSYQGSIQFSPDGHALHSFSYFNGERSLVSVLSERGYATLSTGHHNLSNLIEDQAEIMFFKHLLNENKGNFKSLFWRREGKPNKEVSFIDTNQFLRSKIAWYLPNGLPYAISDENRHKVFVITNASFPIPNEAIVNVVDERTKKNNLTNHTSDLYELIVQNPDHLISETGKKGYMKLTSGKATKIYKIKCGVEIDFLGLNRITKLFIEPGDTLDLILNDNKTNRVEIRKNKNSSWWLQNEPLTSSHSNKKDTTLSSEFKSYLNLKSEISRRIYSFRGNNVDSFKNSITDFYFLKSYKYRDLDFFQLFYQIEKTELLSATGVPLRTSGFNSNLFVAKVLYTQFPLYFRLFNTLAGQYSFNQIIKNQSPYNEFLFQCGDSLLKKNLLNEITNRKSIEPGNVLPFLSIETEDGTTINLLPPKGKYGLLHTYSLEKDAINSAALFENLSENIKGFSCCQTGQGEFWKTRNKSDFPIVTLSQEANHHIGELLVESLISVILLYDDKGSIIYNTVFEKGYDEEDFLKRYIDEINAAIENDKARSKGNLRQILGIIIFSICGTYVIVFLGYRYRLKRVKRKSAQEKMIQELKLKSVQSQLNPHFLFNALNSIQLLINSGNNQQANQYLVGFSELLRGVLKNADKRLVALSDELKLIERYCQLEKLRLDFDFEIKLNTQSPPDLIEVPYMLLQPIVENAIKHGISKTSKNGKLLIEVTGTDQYLFLMISDNGPGFGDQTLEQLMKNGKGLRLSLEKLESIYGNDAIITTDKKTVGEGACITIKLKIG